VAVSVPDQREWPTDRWFLLAGGSLAAIVVGTAAVRFPVPTLAIVIGLIFAGLAVRNLAAGLALFTVLTFFERVPGLEGAGITPVKLAGIVLALAWLATILNPDSRAPLLFRDHPLIAYAALLLAGWALASMLWAEDVAVAGSNALRYAQALLLLFIVYTAVHERRHVRWLVWAILLGGLLTALVALAGASPGNATAPYAEGRLRGGIEDPNELAAVLIPALVLASFAIACFKGGIVRLLIVTSAVILAVTIFLTGSRGGLVALGAVFVAAMLFSGRLRPAATVVILIIAGIGVSYYSIFAPAESRTRVSDFTAGGGAGRTELWGIALEVASDHPILGVGAANFSIVEPSYATHTRNVSNVQYVVDVPRVAHSTYLQILADLGIVGLLTFLFIIAAALVVLGRAIGSLGRTEDSELEVVARGLLVGLIGMLAALVFISSGWDKQLWLLVGFAFAIALIARRSRGSAQAESV
jgi:O-antigen ligase